MILRTVSTYSLIFLKINLEGNRELNTTPKFHKLQFGIGNKKDGKTELDKRGVWVEA